MKRGRKPIPVIKWDRSGEQVAAYTNTKQAIAENHLVSYDFYHALNNGTIIRDHYYTRVHSTPQLSGIQTPGKLRKIAALSPAQSHNPWESPNGMFDIDGWASVMK